MSQWGETGARVEVDVGDLKKLDFKVTARKEARVTSFPLKCLLVLLHTPLRLSSLFSFQDPQSPEADAPLTLLSSHLWPSSFLCPRLPCHWPFKHIHSANLELY